jgi:hypothetical protein
MVSEAARRRSYHTLLSVDHQYLKLQAWLAASMETDKARTRTLRSAVHTPHSIPPRAARSVRPGPPGLLTPGRAFCYLPGNCAPGLDGSRVSLLMLSRTG